MAAVAPAPASARPGESARLGATLALSLIVHGLLVLGVGYTLADAAPVLPTLDVTVAQTPTPLTPEQADFLAAANQQGGGDSDFARRPRDDSPGRLSPEPSGTAPTPPQPAVSATTPPPQTRIVGTRDADARVPPVETHPPTEAMPPQPNPQKEQHDTEMTRLAAEYHLRSELYAKRPKRKFVSASTREWVYAEYLREWVARAERVGNLNYPDEARRKRLAGELVISVAVRRDGSVEQTRIIQSSGVPLLDSTALRIVKLAAPFPPLPKTEENVDILHVTRTWEFLPGGEVVDQ